MKKTAFIICGALGREVLDIIKKHKWDADVVGIPALHHMHPQQIAPAVESKILTLQKQYHRLIVVYGDCGTQGHLDKILTQYGLERVAGPHCYEMYGGTHFNTLITQEPGTFFLTDFLVQTFKGTVLRELGLDRFPDLKEDYFKHYKQIVYLAQTNNQTLNQKAKEIAVYLNLPLQIKYTSYGLLEKRLIKMME